ncbi:MAG TPA: SCO family protein, partial [Humisphaera sp.]|nr:SCO family protein [Humisphaera sp.]
PMTTPSTTPAQRSTADKLQRVLTIVLWLGMICAMLAVVGVKMIFPHRDIPVLYPAGAYALTDQDGKPFSDAALRGKPYVCDFVFTTCGSVCPIMSSKMATLQNRMPASVSFVSFSVDPTHDTPPVLKDYAHRYGADESRWHFLTGTAEQMAAVAKKMNITAVPATKDDPIMHSDRFLLIDGDGNVRGVYDSKDEQSMQKLVDDAAFLSRSRGARG